MTESETDGRNMKKKTFFFDEADDSVKKINKKPTKLHTYKRKFGEKFRCKTVYKTMLCIYCFNQDKLSKIGFRKLMCVDLFE